MNAENYDTQDLIAALATPFAASALAVIRCSGAGSVNAVSRCFSEPDLLINADHGRLVHGLFLHPDTSEPLDDVVLGVYRAPGGYTGEDSVEVFCHGSLPGIEAILKALRNAGFRDALPGEFTFRAFLHGKIDLTRAEAVQEIVSSKSGKAHRFALNRLSGALFDRIDQVKQRLADILSILEVQLDYAEDEIGGEITIPLEEAAEAERQISQLVQSYRTGRIFHEGASIACAGKTNAGKSSLFNLFLKEDRSIVSEIHGTTRDYIESWISIDGMPARLFDTAGVRDSSDAVELEGIRRSLDIVQRSDLVLHVFDGITGMNEQEAQFFQQHRGNPSYLFLWNKSDSPNALDAPEGTLAVSALTAQGFHELEQAVLGRLLGNRAASIEQEQVMIDSLRQKELLDRASDALKMFLKASDEQMPVDILASELHDALDALGQLTGEVSSDDILERIFSGFCVGK